MTSISKMAVNSTGTQLTISLPFAKVNKAKRTVSGFATLDNPDHHEDIVTAEASEKAFASFRSNVREMHGNIAVGKVLSFQPETFFDKESGKTYNGIYVNAYISKGAQDTWEKCLDGTLSSFSIGGNIIDATSEDIDGKSYRVIKAYQLTELSLVDSPANPLANIFSIQKSEDGSSFISGMAVDTNVENVFWCAGDKIASTTNEDSKDCVVCDTKMSNIGWIESSTSDKAISIQKVIDDYLKKDDAPGPDHSATTQDGDAGVIDSSGTINLYPDQDKLKKSESINDSENAIVKGGIKMADENTNGNPVEEVIVKETEEALVEGVDESPAEDPVEKSVTSAESTDSFAKMLTELQTFLTETINQNSADSAEAIKKSVDSVDEAKSEMTKALEDFGAKASEISKNIAEMQKQLDAIEQRQTAYESDTAVKKSSGDVDSAPKGEKIEKSIWKGSFLGTQNL